MGAATREEAEAHKARGNELLKAGKAAEAAEAYGLAIEADPEVAAFWSNRCTARLKAGDATGALADAEEAVRLKPGWTKGHHRKATALQALGRPREGAAACAGGLAAAAEGTEEGELKELRRLKKVLLTSAGELTIRGWWHGKVSETLGGYEQEFHFKPEGVLECVVYGSELAGSYRVADVEEAQGGGFRGGVDVTLNESTKVPYLFRVDDGDGLLHLCCPMVSANERPRTFDGPGYVAMRPGRVSGKEEAALAELPEGRRIVMYLDELATIMESRPSTSTGAGADAAEKLEESGEGSTLTQSQVFGQESTEERAKKMAADQKMAALRIKYTGEIEDIAQKLISGEVDETKAYPDEARDLERMLRRFGGRRKAKEGRQAAAAPAAPAPALADSAVQAPKPAAPAAAPAAAIAPAPSAAPAPAPPAAEKPAAVAASAPRPPAGSCWQACFSGLSRRKQ